MTPTTDSVRPSSPPQNPSRPSLPSSNASSRRRRPPATRRPLRDRYLGRKSSVVASWMQLIGSAPPDAEEEHRPVRQRTEAGDRSALDGATASAAAATRGQPAPSTSRCPGRVPRLGHRHPLTIVRERMEEIFTRMGFAIVEGPGDRGRVALLRRAEHAGRASRARHAGHAVPRAADAADRRRRDADVRTLLRTHTSAMQIRYMQTHQPPIRIVVPGRVYRRDDLDLTHTPMFSQMEGLVVGEGISLADLKGTLLAFAREMFGERSRLRFRPSFFPYTEPSAEVDISCWACDGAGCAMCKKSGWIEILGCGMVHPAVFEAVGYDAGALHRLRLGHRHRARRDPALPGRGHPVVLRERSAVPRAVPVLTDMKLRRCPGCASSCDVDRRPRRGHRATTLASLRGFEVASIERARGRRRGDRLRDHGEPSGLPERARPGARGRHGVRPAAHAAVRRRGRADRAGIRRRRGAVRSLAT